MCLDIPLYFAYYGIKLEFLLFCILLSEECSVISCKFILLNYKNRNINLYDNELVNDWCVLPSEQFVSYIMVITSYVDEMMMSVLY